ncbi:MAG TPA: hypothetical protein VK973_00210 [Arenicellales bacterium]|nr:hypothetical protein [Arenicellales bacterium]
MPDLREPYAYIDQEVDRMTHEASNLRRQAALKVAQAEALDEAAIRLRMAIDKQKRSDEEQSDA